MKHIEVIWSKFESDQLSEIYNYYLDNVSLRNAKRVVEQLLLKTKELSYYPELGQIEELLLGKRYNYRYILCLQYKIIYRFLIENNEICIIDIFPTKMNPIEIARNA